MYSNIGLSFRETVPLMQNCNIFTGPMTTSIDKQVVYTYIDNEKTRILRQIHTAHPVGLHLAQYPRLPFCVLTNI